jgi:hypothetical protein
LHKGIRVTLACALATGALLLGGCAVSLGGTALSDGPSGDAAAPTVTSEKVAETVEGILEEKAGRRPDVDCGADDFALQDGAARTCVLTDPETGLQYDAAVSLDDVKGTDFRVNVDVADQPRTTDEPVADPTTASGSDTVTLTGSEIGETATKALEGKVSGGYEVFCDQGEYTVTAGYQLTCTYQDADGDRPAYIEITSVDGSDYRLSVSVP